MTINNISKFGIIFLLSISLSNIILGQSFNVIPQGHLSGMPGNEYNDIWGYEKDNQQFGIIGSRNAINIVNVTDCAQPTLAWSYVDGSSVIWRDFKTYRNHAYGVCDGSPCTEGLEIINLDNYTFSQNTVDFQRAHNIYIDTMHARLYVVGSNTVGEGLIIYSLNDNQGGSPSTPRLIKKVRLDTLIGNTSLNLYIHDIYVKNHIAYAIHGYSGYYMWDVSDVNNITFLANLTDQTAYNHSSWVDENGTYAYIAEELPRGRPIKIAHITGSGLGTNISSSVSFKDPLESPLYTNNRPHNPFIKDSLLYISYYEDGTAIYDISDRLNPERIAYYDTYLLQNGIGYNNAAHDWKGHWGSYPYLSNGCILASDITSGLYTFTLHIPPQNPTTHNSKISFIGNLLMNDPSKNIVMRNDEGYCYALSVNSSGQFVSTQKICHVLNQNKSDIHFQDIRIVGSDHGIIFKNVLGNYFKIQVNNTGDIVFSPTSVSSTDNTLWENSDLYINDATRGIVLEAPNGSCYRIKINQQGQLITQALTSCQ